MSHKRPRWTGSYTTAEGTAMGAYKLKDKHGHSLKIPFPTKQVPIAGDGAMEF